MTAFRRRLLPQLAVGVTLLLIGFAAGHFSTAKKLPRNPSLPAPLADKLSDAAFAAPSASAPASLSDWNTRWQTLTAKPHSPATDDAIGAALEELAARDPARALALALRERNRRRRTDWLHAALRGWAGVAPEAAAAWIGTLPENEHEGAESAVMDGAARHPDAAVALAQNLIQADPSAARSHANQLLSAFSRTGDYEAGVAFASALPAEIRSEMLGTAYQYWAQSQPETALAAAVQLPEGEARKTAVDAALSGWSQGDPSGLAVYAMNLPAGGDRTAALDTALREWVQVNPKAASDWIDRFDPGPELDAGAAAVAVQPQIVAQQPEVAASWAESITDPALRSHTLTSVLMQWAAADPAAARRYAQNSTALTPEDRAAVLAAPANPAPGP